MGVKRPSCHVCGRVGGVRRPQPGGPLSCARNPCLLAAAGLITVAEARRRLAATRRYVAARSDPLMTDEQNAWANEQIRQSQAARSKTVKAGWEFDPAFPYGVTFVLAPSGRRFVSFPERVA